MSYAQGEADLLTLIVNQLADWDANNTVSVANDTTKKSSSLLNDGTDYKYLFLSPGRFDSDFESINDAFVVTIWQTRITVVVFDRIADSAGVSVGAPERYLVSLRQSIMDLLDSYFQGDSNTISIVKVTSGEEIESWKRRTDDQRFYTVDMIAAWAEEREFTQND